MLKSMLKNPLVNPRQNPLPRCSDTFQKDRPARRGALRMLFGIGGQCLMTIAIENMFISGNYCVIEAQSQPEIEL